MLGLTAFYLSASAVALWVAALSRDRHAVQVAAVMAFSCACANATWITHAWWFWPPMDAAVGWFAAVRCRRSFKPWKLAVVTLSAAQVAAHVRWQIGDKFGGSAYAYHATLNALFLGQLIAAASSGSDRARRRVREFVVDRFRVRRLGRAGVFGRTSRHAAFQGRGEER